VKREMLCMFQAIPPPIIRSSNCIYSIGYFVKLASGVRVEHPDPVSRQSAKPVWHISTVVCTVLDSWWWTQKLSETFRVLFPK